MNEESRDSSQHGLIEETLRNQITNGTYRVGGTLPAQRQLAQDFGVSRDTVQRALRALANEGWVESRQGSGTRVIAIPLGQDEPRAPASRFRLVDAVQDAFSRPAVTIDVFTLTGESLDPLLRLEAEKMRMEGRSQLDSIGVRLLLPRAEGDFGLLRPVGGTVDPRPRERFRIIRARTTDSIRRLLYDLSTEGLVPTVSFELRESPVAPMQKLYLFNATELVTGYYTVVRRHMILDSDPEENLEVYDVLGLGSVLHHHSAADPQSPQEDIALVTRARQWYEQAWANAMPLTAG